MKVLRAGIVVVWAEYYTKQKLFNFFLTVRVVYVILCIQSRERW